MSPVSDTITTGQDQRSMCLANQAPDVGTGAIEPSCNTSDVYEYHMSTERRVGSRVRPVRSPATYAAIRGRMGDGRSSEKLNNDVIR